MLLRPLCFLLILTSFLCSAVNALTFEEEKKVTKKVFENIDRKQLSDSLTTCQHTHQHQGEVECRRLKYVKLVDDDLQKLKTPGSSFLNNAPAVPKVRDIEESYQSLFENYVVQNVPFKGKLMGKSSSATVMSDEALRCLETGKSHHPVTGDLPLRDCVNSDDLRTAVQIPTLAYNSYNVRLASATTESSSDSSSVDLASHWPSLLQVPTSLVVPLSRAAPRSCPANMHLLLWGASAHLTARLFPRDMAAHALSPSPGSDLLHHVQFRAPSDQQEDLYSEVPLMAGGDDYLFVPHDHLVSLAQQQANDEPATVFQMCFFDASNVNYVRESLGVAALVLDPSALGALSQLQSGSGFFDFNMTRKVPSAALSYGEYVNYPRGEGAQEGGSSDTVTTKSKSKPRGRDRSKGGANNFRDWQDAVKWSTMVTSLTLPQPHTPEIVQIGRSNLTLEWSSDYFQQQQHRQQQSLSDGGGSSSSGFNLTVCEVSGMAAAALKGLLGGASSSLDGAVDGCVVVTWPAREFSSILVSSAGNEVEQKFRASVLKLRPNTAYMTRLSLYYENAGGHPSPWSEAFTTLDRTVPASVTGALIAVPPSHRDGEDDPTAVRLEFDQPVDDGGVDILGFHIFARHTEHHLHHTSWAWHAAAAATGSNTPQVNIVVTHLLPKTMYEFRVASFNELGNSSLSAASGGVFTSDVGARRSSPPEIFGLHHERRLGGINFPLSVSSAATSAASPIVAESGSIWVTIDDQAQTLTVIANGSRTSQYEVWDCHWSPRLFKVTAEVVWSIPPLANTKVGLSDDADLDYSRGRILVVKRGAVPIAVKAHNAQKSGAIAVVVLDDERGSCEAFDQRCMAGADKSHGERFAVHDHSNAWANLKIPVLLLKTSDTVSFLTAVGLSSFDEELNNANSSSKSEL